ncbi:hypothetical protein NTJ28_001084 [Flavobacterium psychrophilum]|nr:hypothetical protein [Flavobacterium psychrophilum]
MRKIYYLLIFIFSFSVLSAQEKLSKEEKARREKNIQAGNPFAKYGYKAKVATLSKGKYLEFHDLDSIVTIGTSRWHVDNKKIVGDIVQDTLNIDAQPIGDAPGMWMSPDPLTEEFPSTSPYVAFNNNPVRFTDPTGMAPEDCCDGLLDFVAGSIAGTVSNLTGSNYLRKGEHSTAFNNGARTADAVSLAGGTYLSAKGLMDVGAGTGMLGTAGAIELATAGLGTEVAAPLALDGAITIGVGTVETAYGGFIANNALNNMKSDNSSSNSGNGSSSSNKSESTVKQSKVQKETKTESIGNGKYTKTTEVRPGKGPGQSRAEYIRYKNQDGKVIKNVKDSYDRGNNIQHRKPKELPNN